MIVRVPILVLKGSSSVEFLDSGGLRLESEASLSEMSYLRSSPRVNPGTSVPYSGYMNLRISKAGLTCEESSLLTKTSNFGRGRSAILHLSATDIFRALACTPRGCPDL